MKKIGIYFVILTGIFALASLAAAQDAALIPGGQKRRIGGLVHVFGVTILDGNFTCLQAKIYRNRRRASSHGLAAGPAKIHAGSGVGN